MISEGFIKRLFNRGVLKFEDPFDNHVVINNGWIEVRDSGGVVWKHPVDDSTEDVFDEPIVWAHRSRDGLGSVVNFVDDSFGGWTLSDDNRVLNMSVQDAIRTNPNRITMSMDDMLDMLTEREEQNNGTV